MTMHIRFIVVCSALAACWYEVPDVVTDASAGDVSNDSPALDAMDAALDVNDGGCDPDAAFGTPQPLGDFADPSIDEGYARLSPNELTLYYVAGAGSAHYLYVVTRATAGDSFVKANAVPVPGIGNGNGKDENITVSADGLAALFASLRPDASATTTNSQIWFTTRTAADASFVTPQPSGDAWGSMNGDFDPFFGLGRHFVASHVGYQRTDRDIGDSYLIGSTYLDGGVMDFSQINTTADEYAPVVTPDEHRLYFASNRALDGGATLHVWTSTFADPLWSPPSVVAELVTLPNGLTSPRPSWISPNGCRLYLTIHDGSTDDIYVASK